ncbi:MAG: hypothetical protein LKM35_03745 [Lachnospiraceae bacterium]|jgi:hypothetical protein|nr:hypothetical protein [Lachnospiraceae bacterium]
MKKLIFAMTAALCLLSLASCGKSAEPLSGVSVDHEEVPAKERSGSLK